ncbi:hypothetical protein EDD85DRAFT_963064 [Armillaria nabsnona]|nr:hypothetical protein EDD85DRAFT_963064 [Armillaria nabsnona]
MSFWTSGILGFTQSLVAVEFFAFLVSKSESGKMLGKDCDAFISGGDPELLFGDIKHYPCNWKRILLGSVQSSFRPPAFPTSPVKPLSGSTKKSGHILAFYLCYIAVEVRNKKSGESGDEVIGML